MKTPSALAPEECDLTVGWDCGAHELVVRVRLGRGGAIDDVRFLDNGAEVFTGLAASKPPWLHASGWNRLRLVGPHH